MVQNFKFGSLTPSSTYQITGHVIFLFFYFYSHWWKRENWQSLFLNFLDQGIMIITTRDAFLVFLMHKSALLGGSPWVWYVFTVFLLRPGYTFQDKCRPESIFLTQRPRFFWYKYGFLEPTFACIFLFTQVLFPTKTFYPWLLQGLWFTFNIAST